MSARNITVIPATINPLTRMPSGRTAMKRRVAGYARVSTDSDEQFTSYEAQVDYYTQYIKRNPEWEFVKVYTDEGISGTNTKHRDGFKEMIADGKHTAPGTTTRSTTLPTATFPCSRPWNTSAHHSLPSRAGLGSISTLGAGLTL